MLKTLLGKPVMFYAPFAWTADSALAGLYMSSLFNRLRQTLSRNEVDEEGWFSSPTSQSLIHLHFGRRMLMNARAKLIESGMMEEVRESRMQSQLLSRIMLTTLPAKICLEANEFHSLSESNKLDCRNPTNKSCSKRVTRVAGTVNQEVPEPLDNSSPFRETSSAETATHSNKEINTPYPPLHNSLEGVGVFDFPKTIRTAPASADLENLIYPDKLLPGEKQTARQILHGSPNPQIILDELAGQMQDGHVKNAIGYLRTLKTRQQAGAFEPEYAHRVFFDEYKPDGQGGFEQSGGFWMNASVWDKRGEDVAQHLRKGARVHIAGRLAEQEWTDKESGEVRKTMQLNADDVYLSLSRLEEVKFRPKAQEVGA